MSRLELCSCKCLLEVKFKLGLFIMCLEYNVFHDIYIVLCFCHKLSNEEIVRVKYFCVF